jgi:hypothetical protein
LDQQLTQRLQLNKIISPQLSAIKSPLSPKVAVIRNPNLKDQYYVSPGLEDP